MAALSSGCVAKDFSIYFVLSDMSQAGSEVVNFASHFYGDCMLTKFSFNLNLTSGNSSSVLH